MIYRVITRMRWPNGRKYDKEIYSTDVEIWAISKAQEMDALHMGDPDYEYSEVRE